MLFVSSWASQPFGLGNKSYLSNKKNMLLKIWYILFLLLHFYIDLVNSTEIGQYRINVHFKFKQTYFSKYLEYEISLKKNAVSTIQILVCFPLLIINIDGVVSSWC